jgi:ribosomal protein S18 acetylase RimI-like enzyme
VWEKHLREDILGNRDWGIFVADAGGSLAGQIMGTLRDRVPVFEPARYGYVTDVIVDPAARRSGIGRALFAALKEWFRERGASYLKLQVAHHNPASQGFWRAMGCIDFMDVMWFDLEA